MTTSAKLHPTITTTTTTTPHGGGLGSHFPNVIQVLGHSFWNVACSMLGIIHLRPLYAGYALGGLLLLSLLSGIYAQATGRVKFTLEPIEFHHIDHDKKE
jgi:hypothetical protein